MAGDPSGEQAGGQTEEGHQADDGKTTSPLLDRLLRESFLIFRSVLRGGGRAIDSQDAVATPAVVLGDNFFGVIDHGVVNLLQDFQGDVAAALAVGTALVGRDRACSQSANALRLANGFAAGTARLSHLPEEGPKDQAQIPAPIAGVRLFFL